MSELFMGIIPVKKIIVLNEARFIPPSAKNRPKGADITDVVDVHPISLDKLQSMDLKDKTLFIYPTPPYDIANKVFRVYIE
jgi:hypothetical protein